MNKAFASNREYKESDIPANKTLSGWKKIINLDISHDTLEMRAHVTLPQRYQKTFTNKSIRNVK